MEQLRQIVRPELHNLSWSYPVVVVGIELTCNLAIWVEAEWTVKPRWKSGSVDTKDPASGVKQVVIGVRSLNRVLQVHPLQYD